MEQDQELVARADRAGDDRDPLLDLLGRDRLERPLAERRQQVRVASSSGSRERRRLSAAVLLDVAQPLGAASAKVTPVRHHPRERAAARLVEDVAQPVLGLPLREVAGGGRPRSVQAGPIFFCTWRPSGSRYFAYQTGPRCRSTRRRGRVGGGTGATTQKLTASSGHIRDTFGWRHYRKSPHISVFQPHPDAAAGDRTQDLRIKSPLLYQLSYGGVASSRKLREHRAVDRHRPLDLDEHPRVDERDDADHRHHRADVAEELAVGATDLLVRGRCR